jgi:hypothetical protein
MDLDYFEEKNHKRYCAQCGIFYKHWVEECSHCKLKEDFRVMFELVERLCNQQPTQEAQALTLADEPIGGINAEEAKMALASLRKASANKKKG